MRKSKSIPSQPDPVRRPSRALWWGIGFTVCAAALLIWQLVSPASLERAVGETKVAVEQVVEDTVAPAEYPTIRLGGVGGRKALDRCNGKFIEMRSYRMRDVPPVYAAHNVCGGDVILRWKVGDTVRIDGRDTLYRVVEKRHTPKWSLVTKLRGMKGELVVQTCYYGQNKMRFLGLEPIQPPHGSRPMQAH